MTSNPAGPSNPAASSSSTAADILASKTMVQPFMPRLVDMGLKGIRVLLSESLYNQAAKWGLLAGEVLFFLAALGYLLLATIAGIKGDSISEMANKWGWGLAVLALVYVTLKIIPASGRLIHSTPSRVASSTLLDCIGYLCLVGIIAALVWPFLSIRTESMEHIMASFAICWFGIVVLLMGAVLALNPSLLNIAVEPSASAGEEFLGLVSFLTKGAVALLPIAFAVGSLVVCIKFLVAGFLEVKALLSSAGLGAQFRAENAIEDMWTVLAYVAIGPIVIALGFLAYQLFLDLCRAILTIPSLRGGLPKA